MTTIISTIVVLVLVIAACVIAIRSMVKDKKAGKSIQCGGDCKKCSGCH